MRFDGEVLLRLDGYVRSNPGTSVSAVTNLFVDEALRAEAHPGLTFRPGPTGRRAGLIGGPDVWEVIDTLFIVRDAEPGLADKALVAATAEAMGLPARKVRTAVRYYAASGRTSMIGSRRTGKPRRRPRPAWHAEQDLLRGDDRAS